MGVWMLLMPMRHKDKNASYLLLIGLGQFLSLYSVTQRRSGLLSRTEWGGKDESKVPGKTLDEFPGR